MASEQIGLIVDIDGDIAKGKAKVNELAEYAKKMLGSAMSFGGPGGAFPQIIPPGAKKIVDEFGREFDAVGEKAKSGAGKASAALKGLLKDVKTVEQQIKRLGLTDTMLGRKTSADTLRADFDRLSGVLNGLRGRASAFYSQIDNGTNGSLARTERLFTALTRVESTMNRVGTRFNRERFGATPAQLQSASSRLPVLQDFQSSNQSNMAMARVRGEIMRMQGFNQDMKISDSTGDFFKEGAINTEGVEKAKKKFKELKESASQALKAIPRDAAGADRAIDMLTNSIKSAQLQLDRLENMGRSQNYQRLGMFRNNSISPIFSIQQAIEDFSYAGVRGAANNIAFFLAEIAPATGIGAGLAGGGILALMTYQIYELGKTMKWWASEADLAAEKAKKLASAFGEASSAARGVIDAMATASSGFATGALNLPMNEQGSTYAANRRKALMRTMVNQNGISALSTAIQRKPGDFPFGSVGQNLATDPKIAATRAVMNQNMQAQNVLSTAQMNAPSANMLDRFGGLPGQFFNSMTGRGSAVNSKANQDKLRAQLRPILDGLPGGGPIAGIMDAQIPGQFDFDAMLKPLREAYEDSQKELRKLNSAHDEAMKEMARSSETAAGEVLSVAQSNDRAADAVMGVVRANANLNAEYERQMGLMKTLEVLKDRDQFRSSAFGAMRSKGRQFMERDGVPEWVIQNREMALYQRQAEMLMGSANVAGQAGDTKSQIDYLKQIQQLQFEVIGNTDNRAVAERTMENAIQMQHQIEAVILSSQRAGQSEYEMIQQLTSGLIDMRGVLEMMPQINLGALQQAGEVANLKAEIMGLAAAAASVPPVGGGAKPAAAKPRGWMGWMSSMFYSPGDVRSPAPAGLPASPPLGLNTGGHIPGYGGGDKVPALLEKGEYVINKDAVAHLGVDTLNEMNASHRVRKFAAGGWSGTGYRMVYSTLGRRPDHRGNKYYKSNRTNQRKWARGLLDADRDQAELARGSEQNWLAINRREGGTYAGPMPVASLGAPGSVLGSGFASVSSGMPRGAAGGTRRQGGPGRRGASLRKLPSGAYAGFDANGNELYYGSKKDLQRRSASAASAAPFGTSGLPGVQMRSGDRYGGSGAASPFGSSGLPGMQLRRLPSGRYAGQDSMGNEIYGSRAGLRKRFAANDTARIDPRWRMSPMSNGNGAYSIGGNDNMSFTDWHADLRHSGMILPQSSGIPFTENRREVAMQNRYAKQEAIFNQRQKLHAQLAEQRRAAQDAGRRSVKTRRGWTNNPQYNAMLRAREGRTPQEIYAMRNGGNQRWGPNFNDYVGQMFGGGFSPYMGGGFGYPMMPQRNSFGGTGGVGHGMGGYGATGWGNSFGLYDQGGIGMGGRWGGGGYAFDGPGLAQYVQQIQQQSQLRQAVRGYNSGGFVTPTGGRLINDSPDVYQEDVPWEYLGGAGFVNPDYNWLSFMNQRNRILAGSLNAAYGGPTDFAGNTLGSFGSFSDGTLKSRYSGGFSSVGTSGGFGSGMGGGGFSSFKKPARAMTGGYIGGAGVQRFASGGQVRGGTSTNNVNNNFGTVKIEVKNTKQAMEATQGMRRAKASYWAQRG